MNVLMTGSSGLIGTRLTRLLTQKGHRVFRLRRPETHVRETQSRSANSSGSQTGQNSLASRHADVVDILWDSGRHELPHTISAAFGGGEVPPVDAVINLAGAPIAAGLWTEARKQVLRSSRVETTRWLIAGLRHLAAPPVTLLSASAIGYYGDCGDEVLTEESGAGTNFLAKLARDWEAEARLAEDWGARVVLMRFGIVLAREGGALPQTMAPFRLGLGGKLGSGRQWMSWIEIEDAVCIAHFLLERGTVRGPVNVVSPEPLPNAAFTKDLARAMHRPAIFSVPAAALRLALGEMAEELLLASQRVVPKKLQESGYQFLHPHLDAALHTIVRN
jgi:uncharacterized protein